ncbi:hypothetical protein D3C85_1466520 [compost metagenome]
MALFCPSKADDTTLKLLAALQEPKTKFSQVPVEFPKLANTIFLKILPAGAVSTK